jgi:flagellar FliJ protein
MPRWAESLIKLSTYEVETLQKRLADITAQRAAVELRIERLHAEGLAEQAAAAGDPQNAWRIVSYLEGLRLRIEQVHTELHPLQLEEQGARDALAKAFEAQKKYEHVAEQAQLAAARTAGQRENAQMDELGLRRAGGAR